MEKVKQWITDRLKETAFAQTAQWRIKEGTGEGYEVLEHKGKLQIKADSGLAAAYALHQLELAWKAGHFADYLGRVEPKFTLRPLWLAPEYIQAADIESLCRITVALGFNAWIVGSFFEGMFSLEPCQKWPVAAWRSLLHSYGLKLWVKPQFQRAFGYAAVCPLDSTYRLELEGLLESWLKEAGECDGVFWESPRLEQGFENALSVKDCLHGDILVSELKMLERGIGGKKKLIYYLPADRPADAAACAPWITSLCDAAAPKTMIAFPATAGSPFDDHLPPHPCWAHLRASSGNSAAHLLPIVNGGGISQGEGLWPGLALDLFLEYIPRCYRHPFAGIIIPAQTLPRQGTFLQGSLWIGSQAQWGPLQPELIADTWLAAYRSKEPKEALHLIRHIIKEISYLRSTAAASRRASPPVESKARVEKAIASLKYLEHLIPSARTAAKSEASPLADYYPLFVQDAKRMIGQLARHLSIPTPHLLPAGGLDDCFWSEAILGPSQWRRSGPRRGDPGSKMAAILIENGFET